ncbi:hypothetical protein X798_06180 [Onchocerca flexuosa]|uniref:Uncharacterized protein n=1 Tax=Onchocerca flexuosa TaxID=387005 RepID=A0A238BQ63_9BILA|nr:hypothetical protein X798_06180 [Onchocerca flexuosa]
MASEKGLADIIFTGTLSDWELPDLSVRSESFQSVKIPQYFMENAAKTIILSGRRFTGRNDGASTLESGTENDSNYFKLLEADGNSLLVGARKQALIN